MERKLTELPDYKDLPKPFPNGITEDNMLGLLISLAWKGLTTESMEKSLGKHWPQAVADMYYMQDYFEPRTGPDYWVV